MFNNPMWLNQLLALLTALVVSAGVTPVVRKVALRWKLGDKPNGRRIHTHMIPHLGGIALVLGVGAGLAVALGGAGASFAARTAPAAAVIVVLGLVDDVKSLRAGQKLGFQILAAAVLSISGFTLITGVPLFDGNLVTVMLVTGVFFVGMPSAVNLIDGHDGLAAGVALISSLAFAVMAMVVGDRFMVAVSLSLAGACIGFLVYNFPPGRIYMGDTGSMFLGVMLALVACSLTMSEPSLSTFVGVCFVLGVPILDVMLAIARRLALHSPLFAADSLHMHHVLSHLGFTPRQVLLVVYSMQAVLAVIGVATMAGVVLPVIAGLSFIGLAFVSFLRLMVASRPSGGRVATGMTPTSIPLKNGLPSQRGTAGR